MTQPIWKLVAQLGDANPIEHGGYFVYEDETGVYPPEGEVLLSPDSDDAPEGWQVYRFSLDRCTFIDGLLSDNEYHPDKPAWFAEPEEKRAERPQDTTYLSNVAQFIDQGLDELRDDLCSEDTVRRAWAWKAIGDYHGLDNLDHDPLTFSDRHEVEMRYADHTGYKPSQYEVIVGNVGSVYHGPSLKEATNLFNEYVQISKTEQGMAGGEDVTLFCDGEIEDEFIGSLSRAEMAEHDD